MNLLKKYNWIKFNWFLLIFFWISRPNFKAPAGTIEYIADKDDTLERIALKWNTIPSDILSINRLINRSVFPGQVLYVPDPNNLSLQKIESKKTDKKKLERSVSDEEYLYKWFLRLESKIISYDGSISVVNGFLLLTPTAMMFDPKENSQNDPLHASTDNNSITIPIEMISNVILFGDISIHDLHGYLKSM